MTKKNKANKIFMAVLFVLIVGFAFLGCENGTTNGANSFGNYDTGKTVFGIPYITKESGIKFTKPDGREIPYSSTVYFLNTSVDIAKAKIIDLFENPWATGGTYYGERIIELTNYGKKDNWIALTVWNVPEGYAGNLGLFEKENGTVLGCAGMWTGSSIHY